MRLHIFNPEHDIALASGLSNFTAPHAGRQLRHDLGFLPAVWAKEGDVVMVDDVDQARAAWQRLHHRIHTLLGDEILVGAKPEFAPTKLPLSPEHNYSIEPWGWNSALRAQLQRRGLGAEQLPTEEQLQTIRLLSHRRTAGALLPKLRVTGTVGETFECSTEEQVESLLAQYGHLVLKAPWSSSGRGLRFLSSKQNINNSEHIAGWFRNVVDTQGSVMVEPYYNKVKDFGMEFFSDGVGGIDYLGLSVFHTTNGAYTGNILATEKVKREMISHYISMDLIENIQGKICRELSEVFNGKYRGSFGIDMMLVNGEQCQLHPCVEINLRRTMGHVALSLSPADDELRCVMRIEYTEGNYKLTINRL